MRGGRRRAERVGAVCIGVQGALDPRTDELTYIETLPGWPKQGIRRRLGDALGLAVRIDNDVNLAALAERTDGAGRDTGGFALLWMGEGLGLVRRPGRQRPPRRIGRRGRDRLPARSPARRPSSTRTPATCRTSSADPPSPGSPEAHGLSPELDGSGATPARRSSRELARRVAVGVVPVLALLDPELVVLGGPTGLAGGPRLAELVTAELRPAWGDRSVVATGVAAHPVLRGAREHLIGDVRDALFAEVSRIAP